MASKKAKKTSAADEAIQKAVAAMLANEKDGKKPKKSVEKPAESSRPKPKAKPKDVEGEGSSRPLPKKSAKTAHEKGESEEGPKKLPAAAKDRRTAGMVYRCVACEDMTKVVSPSCRCCQTVNGYQPTPPGTRLPKKRHGVIKQAGGFGSFGDFDLGSGSSGSSGASKSKTDDDDFDPDDEADVVPIGEIESEERVRISTGIPSLDRVLGGNKEEGYGIVAGSSVLLDGSPGIGKSTLLIQALAKLAEEGTVLYVTGEESAADIKGRAERLKILTKKNKKNILVVETTDTDQIIDIIEEEEPIAVILDSIQMFYSDDANGQAGSEPQCKYILENLIRATCKPLGIALFVVSQVTKDGDARGPQTIAHMVDAHLKFESVDPKNRGETKRILHQKKNRNGDISIIRYFRMTEEGLKGLKPTGDMKGPKDEDDEHASLF